LPTTAFTFANENNPVFRPNFDHIPREPFAPPPELLEAARQKHFAGPPSGRGQVSFRPFFEMLD